MKTNEKEIKEKLGELFDLGFTNHLELSEIINNHKTNLNTMDKVNLLPGEYPTVDGKILVVAEDGTFEIKEAVKQEEMAQDVKPEDTTKQEEMANEMPVKEEDKKEVVKEEMAEGDTVQPEAAPVETYSKEEVDAKFDELYKLIADMKAEEVVEDSVEETKTEEVKMSVHQRFASFINFSRQ